MVRWIYSILLVLASPLLLGWMAWRARRAGGDWSVFGRERFGRYARRPSAQPGAVWVHAVSLGETRAAQPLIRALLDRGHRVLLTHLTATGRAEGRRAYADDIAAGRLRQLWLPYDFPGATRRFMRCHRPALGVLIERELWPNLVHAAVAARVPLVLASARMSPASLRQNLHLAPLLRPAYAGLSRTYAQSEADAKRLEQVGAANVSVSGNFKFDLRLDARRAAQGRDFAVRLARPVVVIASTREGEDPGFVAAIRRQVDRWNAEGLAVEGRPLFMLIPRHPQRFDAAAGLLESAGLPFVRRTRIAGLGEASDGAVQACRGCAVVLGDTLGEMPWYYACAQVAIVGGSFAPLGGQNFIEASALGCPVLVGPHVANFDQAVADALQAGALRQARTPEAALQCALQWLGDGALRARMGEAALRWISQHTGAVARVVAGIEALLREDVNPG
jgi:3-deoxy-D-manno-octulosonic-acid transferase